MKTFQNIRPQIFADESSFFIRVYLRKSAAK